MFDYLSTRTISQNLSKQGVKFEFLPEIDSTNDYLKRKVLAGEVFGPLATVAEKQVKGKGTKGRLWMDDSESCLKFSMVTEYRGDPKGLMTLSPLLAINLTERLSELNNQIQVKWPNDLMTAEGKLSGILIEAVSHADCLYLIFGIGINLFPTDELKKRVNRKIAFVFEGGDEKQTKRGTIIELLTSCVLKTIQESVGLEDTFLSERWKKFDYFYQKSLIFRTPDQTEIEGIEEGISENGKIRLIVQGLLKEFNSGEIVKEHL